MKRKIQNFTKVITTEFAGAVKEGKSYHLTPNPSPDRGEGGRVKFRLSFKNRAAFTLLVKPFRSNPLTALLCSRRSRFAWFLPINVRATAAPLTPALRQKSALLTKERGTSRAAFTLAETLITVVILGILAAILVPNLIKNQVENANRTKVKKAMAAYEKAINYMIIENDIKSSQNIKDFGEEESCKYASEYFKKVQKGNTDCVFKTPDRVWWNISDLSNPIIILKDELKVKNPNELRVLAKDFNDKNVFALIGRFDDLGSLRVDDNGFEQSQENNDDNKLYMTKL